MNEEEKKDDVFNTSRFKKLYAEAIKDQEKKAIKPGNGVRYLVLVVVMVLVGMSAIPLIVWLRPDSDILIVATVVFGFLTPTTASILTYMKSQETHLIVNSKLDQWKNDFMAAQIERSRAAEEKAFGEGRREGRDDANARTDKLAEKK